MTSSPSPLTCRIVPAACPAAQELIAALDRDIINRYPGLPTNGINAVEFEAAGGVFVIGYIDGRPAACGAIRPFEDAAEVKRMFVAPAFRRLGLARRMLRFLEEEAARRGYSRAILETGRRQTEAIALYESAGWQHAAAYGQFVGNPESLCFEKRLEPVPAR